MGTRPLGLTTDPACDPSLTGLAATASASIATEGGVSALYIAGGGTDSVGSGNVYIFPSTCDNPNSALSGASSSARLRGAIDVHVKDGSNVPARSYAGKGSWVCCHCQ